MTTFLHDSGGIREGIERRIPLSAGKYNRSVSSTAKARVATLEKKAGERLGLYKKLSGRADWRLQLGSLGSGNHFIEITLDESEGVWAFLHSGSRGIGNKIAMQHIRAAQRLMKRESIRLPDRDLAYLSEGTEEFDEYIRDLRWAQDFALLNREEMMDRVMTELSYTVYGEGGHEGELELERIQCHHNFTQKERHYGKDVLVSRKGAIQAKEGQMGLIPGSMGTASYVVRGLGSVDAFETAPHGAGRRFSRTQARKRFSMDDFDRDMQGIEVRRSKEFIDELPGRLQGHRHRHGAVEGPRGDRPHLPPDRKRQGRLTRPGGGPSFSFDGRSCMGLLEAIDSSTARAAARERAPSRASTSGGCVPRTTSQKWASWSVRELARVTGTTDFCIGVLPAAPVPLGVFPQLHLWEGERAVGPREVVAVFGDVEVQRVLAGRRLIRPRGGDGIAAQDCGDGPVAEAE